MEVLLVENGCVIARSLQAAGHGVAVASSPDEARALLEIASFDAIVLGGAGPDAASASVYGDLRQVGTRTPILLLVEGSEAETRVRGLDAGADDCIDMTCPFDELLARLRALTRRAASSGGTGSVGIGDLREEELKV